MFPTESMWVRPNNRSNGFMIQIKNPYGLNWNGWGEFYARPGDPMAQPGQHYDMEEIMEQQAQQFPDVHLPLVPMEQIQPDQIQFVPADQIQPVEQIQPDQIELVPVENEPGPLDFDPEGPIPHAQPGPWENPTFNDHGPMENDWPRVIIDNVNFYQEGDPGVQLIYIEENNHEEFSDIGTETI